VICRSARIGTGIVAGGPMRSIFECIGIQDIVAKSLGSANPHNVVYATLAALKDLSNARWVAERRGMKVTDLLDRINS
jgi:small subunit ribosomal protein S5